MATRRSPRVGGARLVGTLCLCQCACKFAATCLCARVFSLGTHTHTRTPKKSDMVLLMSGHSRAYLKRRLWFGLGAQGFFAFSSDRHGARGAAGAGAVGASAAALPASDTARADAGGRR